MFLRALAPSLLAICLIGGAPIAARDDTAKAPADGAGTQDATRAKAQAVQRHIDAYRARDLDRFIATFAPDAEVYANGMVAKGHKQIRALYALNFAPGAPTIAIKDSGMSGAFVYVSIAYVTADGSEICCSYSEYDVVDAKITYLSASS